MPFDGIVTKCIVKELSDLLTGSRIEKIFQPERDEILINIRAQGQNLKLLLSANANYPRIHITEFTKENPAVPPVFCMLLRKHLSGGKVLGVDFHDYERIITINVEAMNELGDLSVKKLIIEIMGRHSNIILTTAEDKIIDAIKHVDFEISSVREVMPARNYVFPPAQNKTSPEDVNYENLFSDEDEKSPINVEKLLLNTIKGFSPLLCSEACFRAGVDGKASASNLSDSDKTILISELKAITKDISANTFSPCMVVDAKESNKPIDFHCLQINQYPNIIIQSSMSKILDSFYSTRDNLDRLKQKKADVYKVLGNSIDRCNKKLAIQEDKLRDVSDREKLKLFGELITANIYCIPANTNKVSLLNYYSEDEEYVEIKLDENLTAQQNAQRFFKKYSKAKSTFNYTSKQLEETRNELEYLDSVLILLDSSVTLQEIDEIREELIDQGYYSIKRKNVKGKKRSISSEPHHFKSSDGLDIFVGKNNKQNDLLTLKSASSNDIWLHTKNIPGSHVIIRKTQQDIPDRTLLEAAILASYHSKAKMSSTVPVDYTAVKNVKKPSGAKPGMVIYENFKTIYVTPDEELVNKLKQKK
jgi:predicted ribosome quality control (RQC) complex YloA/Tae2 family protein